MKTNIIIVIALGIFTGYLFGNLLYKNYDGLEYQESDGNIYYIQYGVYTSSDAAFSNAINLDNYIIKEMDNKYYIYLGVTTSYDIALQIQELYEEKDIYSYIRSDYVENSETLELLKEYDLRIENNEEIKNVIKEIFNNQELIF